MSSNNIKYGTFKGVFTPSILTILGVIMYMRLPWIVGQAGLWSTLGIILVAHLISITTGLSVSSIATDKKVETGGTYYMISRSLGLPIGGTLGMALFVGLSLSVSLYLIGFSEILLNTIGIETSLNNIRITGVISLLAITILTFISTNLALKTQFIILTVMALSLVSIFIGNNNQEVTNTSISPIENSLPWIALFAIFFPAVTGFEAGVSMSGDLQNPKKAIPQGTILAIIVGLCVYLCLTFFFSYSVDRELLVNDNSVLLKISWFAPIVVAGIMGATLSSALGSILGAPRILQATASDKITPKIFAKGYGKSNEPRNALILTFVIALAGILIGELNTIARVVSIFFIITYGFLNLTCALENWAGSDFRPSFRIPGIISIIGAIACFVVMIQLDLAAMLVASAILIALFLFLKRKELKLESGDTWNAIWTGIVKAGLIRLSGREKKDKRNWKPNIILFSGKASERPHLIEMGRFITGKLGIFTNFELIEDPDQKHFVDKSSQTNKQTDHLGKTVFTRKHVCTNIYQGIDTISRVYGFSGFEPNTVVMGWPKKPKDTDMFYQTLKDLSTLDFNLALLHFNESKGYGNKKLIDIWWGGKGQELTFALTLCKFITSNPSWRSARIRILYINYKVHQSERIHSIINQLIENHRIAAELKIINNFVDNLDETMIIQTESAKTDLCFIELYETEKHIGIPAFDIIEKKLSSLGSCMLIKASSDFESVGFDEELIVPPALNVPSTNRQTKTIEISNPSKPEAVSYFETIKADFGKSHLEFNSTVFDVSSNTIESFLENIILFQKRFINTLPTVKSISSEELKHKAFIKVHNDFTLQVQRSQKALKEHLLPQIADNIAKSIESYVVQLNANLIKVPEKIFITFPLQELKSITPNTHKAKAYLKRQYRKANLYGKKNTLIPFRLRHSCRLLLINRRLKTIQDVLNIFEIVSFQMLSNLRNNLINFNQLLEKAENINQNEASSIEGIEKEAIELATMLEALKQSTVNRINKLSERLDADFFVNLQKISNLIEKPHSHLLLVPYAKALKTDKSINEELSAFASDWLKNMQLFMEKNKLEFILVTLKARIKARIKKQLLQIKSKANEHLFQRLDTLNKEIQHSIETQEPLPEKTLRLILDNNYEFDFKTEAQIAFDDIQHLVEHIPEEITIIDDSIFSYSNQTNLSAIAPQTIPIRKIARYQVGAVLFSQVIRHFDTSDNELNDASSAISDIIRLCLSTIDLQDVPLDNKEVEKQRQELLFSNIQKRIEEETYQIENILNSINSNIDDAFKIAYDPLSLAGIKHIASFFASKNLPCRIWPFKWPTSWLNSLKHGINQTLVRLLYTRSEGIIWIKKFSDKEENKITFSQDIHQLIEELTPSAQVLKDTPFYYQNLFSGHSPVNSDMWVGMETQINQARLAIKRFQNGYSGAILITGPRNSGKSGLSKMICQKVLPNWDVIRIKPPKEGSSSTTVFHQFIKQSLNFNEADFDTYLASLATPRVIIINDLELWWARNNNGHHVLKEIKRLIDKYGSKHLFIINSGTSAWNFISKMHWSESSFLAHLKCQPLDARELRDLVILRHKAGGLTFYLNSKAEKQLSQWEMARLFNRYFTVFKGNPGYTLQAWVSNIQHQEARKMVIRMPSVPYLKPLENLNTDTLNLLVQFVLHRRISIPGMASIMGIELSQSVTILNGLHRMGLIHEKFQAVYALNPYLEPFIIQILEEREML